MSVNSVQIEAQISNWAFTEDFEVKRWLQGKAEGTKPTYICALKSFLEFTGLSPKQLIDEAELDRQKSVRERGGPEYKVGSFYDWLLNEYVQKIRGRTKGIRVNSAKKGTSKNLATSYANTIKGFYRVNGFPLTVEIQKGAPKKENFKLALRIPQIKSLLDATTNLRDKAIILTLFQSGMSINELCYLTYGDVANGLQANEEPLNLHLIRKKEQVEYDTFLGTDAIEAIKSYLAQRKRNGEVLSRDSPLFIIQFTTDVKSSRMKKLYPALVEASLKSAALKAGLVTQQELNAADVSPCRPHAIRTAFISILKMAGLNDTLVEYFCGHTISATDKAYLRLTVDELRKTYKQYEKYLSITGVVDSEKLEKLEQKAKMLEQNSQSNQGVITALLENGKNKDVQIANVTGLLTQIQDTLNSLNREMDYHRMEDVARFVMIQAPSREEMVSFLNRRQISQSIFQRSELQCIVFSPEANKWLYIEENDIAKLLIP